MDSQGESQDLSLAQWEDLTRIWAKFRPFLHSKLVVRETSATLEVPGIGIIMLKIVASHVQNLKVDALLVKKKYWYIDV